MIVYNYTGVRRRDKRIYTFFNSTISRTGIIAGSIITSAVLVVVFSIPALILCAVSGTFWYNPISLVQSSMAGYFYLAFVVLPISMGFASHSVKIQNYKLIDYLKIYFSPRITIDQNGRRVILSEYKINSLIERI